MLRLKIKGKIGNKPYLSKKTFSTSTGALTYAYKKVYKKDGNTKRKNQLHSFHLIDVDYEKKMKGGKK